jgi:selenocysteine-specific elongation factor
MSFVIGTAGHIDHGKTSLVKALTGQDTDRLKEEKERGISIDLGFAHLDLSGGTRAAVIDVPGHERFIHNMLAGAHGIDLALFTVAADDGVMPQTEEHFDIVRLLGIPSAIFVITKVDLVDDARVSEVKDEIGLLVSGTRFESAPILACSIVTGGGLHDLCAGIERVRQELSGAARDDSMRQVGFRLPVDRAFLLQGHGLVVTGTALGGEVRVGDQVRCLPADHPFRVRSVQVHNESVESARGGQRVALNLVGSDKVTIERGDVICHEGAAIATGRFDARLEVTASRKGGVKNHQRVRVHVGTAACFGRLILLGDTDALGPKQTGFCQIAVSAPLVAMRGDRFVIRDETARRTLGGGIVVHPLAHRHKRREAGLLERLERLQNGSLADAVEVLLTDSAEFAVTADPLHQILNVPAQDVREQLAQMPGVASFDVDGERFYVRDHTWRQVREAVRESLVAFHGLQPLSSGMEMEAVREGLGLSIPSRLFRVVIERLAAEGLLVREGSLLRLSTHTITLREDDRVLADRVAALVGREPCAPPDLKTIQREIGVNGTRLADVLRVMERQQSIVRVSAELYFAIGAIENIKAALTQHLSATGDITPATFRDLFGTTRKYAIPLLEYLDREGFTIRVGDARRLRR